MGWLFRRGRAIQKQELNVTSIVGAIRSAQILKHQISRMPLVDKELLVLANCRRITAEGDAANKYWITDQNKLVTNKDLDPISPIIEDLNDS